jgi:hypothetical protein
MLMMVMRQARRKFVLITARTAINTQCSIIQDCEDALTNWVVQNASVTSKLSTRSRTLSQRRKNAARHNQEGVDLSHQDQPLDNRESGLWIPASEHQGNGYEDDDLEDDVPSTVATETRGREEERPIAA